MKSMQINMEILAVLGPIQPRIYDRWVPDNPRCDCGCRAKVKIYGRFRCKSCAEDEEVMLLETDS